MTQRNDDAPVNILDRIDQLARDFRKQVAQQNSPRIEEFLTLVATEGRESLFSRLLEIEINYRRSQGDLPTSDVYLKRFPHFKRQVRRAFFEPSQASVDSDVSRNEEAGEPLDHVADPESHLAPTDDLTDANVFGAYERLSELGRGGMGIVYEAKNKKTGNRVALKTLPMVAENRQVNADRLFRFRKEFRRLAEINHPNLVGMQSLEVDGNRWFFTMDLIDGEDFLKYVRPGGRLNEARLRKCLRQLAIGIIELHRHGIIHRDLKPGNVLVAADGHLTILDFGLAAELQRSNEWSQTRSGMFAGTPRYAAPEQIFGNRTEASDWYAFGAMLYEALTGELPFTGNDAMAVLRQKQEQDPPQLAEAEGIAHDLAALTNGLIARDPEARLTAGDVAERLDLDTDSRTGSSTRETHSSTHAEDVENLEAVDAVRDEGEELLIGREDQLAELHAIGEDFLRRREPQSILISGLSGEGKSTLARVFLREFGERHQVTILTGRCYERESVPFKAIDCWLDQLVAYLRRQSAQWFEQNLPPDIAGLAQIFPVLRRVPAIRKLPLLDSVTMTPEKLRFRAFNALRDLLAAMSAEISVVIYIDDLQWGDADSVAVFQRIFDSDVAPAVLLVGACRSDEVKTSPFIGQWRDVLYGIELGAVHVQALSLEQARALVTALLPQEVAVIEAEIERIHQQAGGNPYLLTQLVDSFDEATGRFQPLALGDLIRKRLSYLPPEARPLLEVIAVNGQSLSIELLSSIVSSVEDLKHNPLTLLAKMQNEKLIRVSGDKHHEQVDSIHDKVRETVVAGLDDDRRKGWHERIAVELENLAGATDRPEQRLRDEESPTAGAAEAIPGLFQIAHHFHAAEHPKAFGYLVAAGESALNGYCNFEAIDWFEQARTLVDEETPAAIRFRIEYGIAEGKLRVHQLEDAIALLDRIAAHATSDFNRAQVHALLGFAYGILSQLDRSVEYSDRALENLGSPRPQRLIAILLNLTWTLGRAIIGPHRLFRPIAEAARVKVALEVQIHQRLKHFLVQRDIFQSLYCWGREAELSFRLKTPVFVASGHSIAEMLLTILGLNYFAKIFGRRYSITDANMSADPEVTACLCWNRGGVEYFNADFAAGLPIFQVGAEAAAQSGNAHLEVFSIHFKRHTYAWIGSTSAELDAATEELEKALACGDKKGISWAAYGKAEALARRGSFMEAAADLQFSYAQFSDEAWYATLPVCQGVHGLMLLQVSQSGRAQDVLAAAWKLAVDSRNFHAFNCYSHPLLLESLVGPQWLEDLPRDVLTRARRLDRWTPLLYIAYPVLRVPLLRSSGRLAAARGKTKRALRKFRRALSLTERIGMPYFRAKVLLDLAALEEEGRDERRRQAVELLQEMESVISRAESWLLADQYDDAVVAPEFDLDAWEQEHGAIAGNP